MSMTEAVQEWRRLDRDGSDHWFGSCGDCGPGKPGCDWYRDVVTRMKSLYAGMTDDERNYC